MDAGGNVTERNIGKLKHFTFCESKLPKRLSLSQEKVAERNLV